MSKLARRLAQKLQALRGDTPQLQYAKKLGISNSSLNRMELGEQNVTLETLEILCRKLDCDVADLFPKENSKRRTKLG